MLPTIFRFQFCFAFAAPTAFGLGNTLRRGFFAFRFEWRNFCWRHCRGYAKSAGFVFEAGLRPWQRHFANRKQTASGPMIFLAGFGHIDGVFRNRRGLVIGGRAKCGEFPVATFGGSSLMFGNEKNFLILEISRIIQIAPILAATTRR
jgi:hypothetical protein